MVSRYQFGGKITYFLHFEGADYAAAGEESAHHDTELASNGKKIRIHIS